ncbi:ABC transporter permease subunit, partial [Bacillus wiedmannii]|uniref:ABC transporter permease subunit n=1 Tax=Bacillus wiedmannii TaxID=1890302 RepID=UPI002112086A
RSLATAYNELFRGLPAMLVFISYGYGDHFALGIQWPIPLGVIVSLGMVSSAYIAETLRAGLQAVPKGQVEGARSLGMP